MGAALCVSPRRVTGNQYFAHNGYGMGYNPAVSPLRDANGMFMVPAVVPTGPLTPQVAAWVIKQAYAVWSPRL